MVSTVEKPQKLFVVVVLLAFVAVISSLWYWRINIYEPFLQDTVTRDTSAQEQALEEFSSLLATQQTDTDGDGLTDYFETNIYGTSIYLPDTDSDGFSDKEEVDSGNNPLCPAGEVCGLLGPGEDDAAAIAESLLVAPSTLELSDPSAGGQLRELLIAEGVDPFVLSEYTNEELAQLYEQVVAASGTESDLGSVTEEDLVPSGDLTASELRDLLVQGGIAREVVDAIPDDELVAAYEQVINSETTN